MVPHSLLSAQTETGGLDALIWLEQTEKGRFRRHAIQATSPVYVAMTVTDLDDDKAPDIVVGCFYEEAQTSMPRAIAFYTKCGFADAGSVDFWVGPDRQTDRLMAAPLAPP